jgi:hypothetical protein
MNITNTLNSLKINSEPFYPKEIKKIKEKKEGKEVKFNIEESNFLLKKENEQLNSKENKKINSNANKISSPTTANKNENAQPTNEELYGSIHKLKTINLNEIKEYIPKNYKLVSKDNSYEPAYNKPK